MAQGDAKSFSEYNLNAGQGEYNLSTDDIKWVIVTDQYSTVDVDVVTQLSEFTQVASAGAYVANTSIANPTWTRLGAVTTLDGDDFTFAANASNPITGRSLLIYDDTTTSKNALVVVDLTVDGSTPADTTQGLTYTISADGIMKVTRTV